MTHAPLLAFLATLPFASDGEVTPDAAWLARVQRELGNESHAFVSDGAGGARARNAGHGFTARFGASEVVVEVGSAAGGESRSSLSIALGAWGRGGELAPLPVAALALDEARATLARGAIVEWWTNGPAGMEQGFELAQPPAAGAEGPLVLALELGGSLAAQLSADRGALVFSDGGRDVLRYGGLHAFDADGDELEARMELRGTALHLEIEDAGARYPLSVDPLLESVAWSDEGDQSFAYFGFSVATAGDVNGDGLSDVLVGSHVYDSPGMTDHGAVFLYLGTPDGLSPTTSWRAFGSEALGRFGHSVAPAGDVNGDGFGDVLVGEPDALADAGRAYLYYGNAGGSALALGWSIAGGEPDQRLGSCVAYAGDVNADGFADVIVGSPEWNFISIDDAGRADVYLGSAQGLSTTPSWSCYGDWTGGLCGRSVATAGDVNGDGFDDVAVGEPLRANGGRVRVYPGGAGGTAVAPSFEFVPNLVPNRVGWSVATAGDVNRDGFADLAVGAPYRFTAGGTQAGQVMVFRGSAAGLESWYSWSREGTVAYGTLGYCVASAGDVNGDGYADLLAGAPGMGTQGAQGGAQMWYGSSSGLESTAGWDADAASGITLGHSLATAGDVDGDGFSDVVVGQHAYSNGQQHEGIARVYHGAGAVPSIGYDHSAGHAGGAYGSAVANAGDVNGDGYDEVIAGAPFVDVAGDNAGFVRVSMGNRDMYPGGPYWTAQGPTVGARFGSSVSSAGDVDGDGYDEVIVGAPGYADGQSWEGAAFLYRGSPQGLPAQPDWSWASNISDAYAGTSVARAGDVNGDGFSDVIVGAPRFEDAIGYDVGAAFVFYGSPAGLAAAPDWRAEGDGSFGTSWFGHSVAAAGDVNGDGFDDVLVGEPLYGPNFEQGGRAHVFLGSPHGLEPTAAWTGGPIGVAWWMGWSVASAGDVNGDSYSDVAIGAPGANSTTDGGRVLIYFGSPNGLSPLEDQSLHSPHVHAQFGWSVAAAGDGNADGFGDLLVGGPQALAADGRAYFYLGSPGGLAWTPAWTTPAIFPGDTTKGWSVGGAGDINGDGFADFIVGAPGRSGALNTSGAIAWIGGNTGDASLSFRDRRPAQLQLDGVARIGLHGRAKVPGTIALEVDAHSPAGRARVWLEWQHAPLGQSLAARPIARGAEHDTGPTVLNESAVRITEIEDGLAYDEVHAWRLRVASANPLFPHGPWLSASGNSPTEGKVSTRVGTSAEYHGARRRNP